jgi:hypothetical protein
VSETGKPATGGKPASRRDLLYLLSQAAELEHSLACQYIFAACTLKQGTDEGISEAQRRAIRRWRERIIAIAEEEMLHLALASNLLTALGGAPYLRRANFPQAKTYTSLGLRFVLAPFGEASLRRFICFELPQDFEAQEGEEDWNQICAEVKAEAFELAEPLLPQKLDYSSIGELYTLIRDGIEDIEERLNERGETLFIGPPAAQATGIFVDASGADQLVAITDVTSAQRAIDLIIEQGEGTPKDQESNHFRWFIEILREYSAELNRDPSFHPARRVIENPLLDLQHVNTLPTRPQEDPTVPFANTITDALSHDVVEIFCAVYEAMLYLLSRFFAHSGEDDEQLYILRSAFLNLMEIGLSPLASAITRLPAGENHPGMRAGPSFEIFCDVQLLPQLSSAWVYLQERVTEIAEACEQLAIDASTASHGVLRVVLRNLSRDLRSIAFTFSLGLKPPVPETLTWTAGISQLFSPLDIRHMLALGRDLTDYESVKADGETILFFVSQGLMPKEPLGRWTSKRVQLFEQWKDNGFPE